MPGLRIGPWRSWFASPGREGFRLPSYVRVAKRAAIMIGRYTYAHQPKRMRRELKRFSGDAGCVAMSDLFLLPLAQMRWIAPYFPLSHGIPRVDDRRVISGIIFVIKNGLRWRDAPKDYGPHKTIYNRFIRWSELGVFNRIFAELAGKGASSSAG